MTTYNITSDTDQINIKNTAKHVIDLIGLKDGTIILISPTEYNVIENGGLKSIEAKNIDPTLLSIFAYFEKQPNKPKYPYLIVTEEINRS